ncbi:hypothetical protein JZ751_020864, partial [Albula glossodonta]
MCCWAASGKCHFQLHTWRRSRGQASGQQSAMAQVKWLPLTAAGIHEKDQQLKGKSGDISISTELPSLVKGHKHQQAANQLRGSEERLLENPLIRQCRSEVRGPWRVALASVVVMMLYRL